MLLLRPPLAALLAPPERLEAPGVLCRGNGRVPFPETQLSPTLKIVDSLPIEMTTQSNKHTPSDIRYRTGHDMHNAQCTLIALGNVYYIHTQLVNAHRSISEVTASMLVLLMPMLGEG